MRYLFVFISIVALWVALLLVAMAEVVDVFYMFVVVLIMTLVLFFIGFGGKRR